MLTARVAKRSHSGQSVRTRRSTDGRNFFLSFKREGVLANPSYILSMRILRARRLSMARFLVNAHSILLGTLGVGVGALTQYGLPVDWVILTAPLGLIYYVWFGVVGVNLLEELHRRRHLVDLYLVSYYDPLLLGAGVVSAERYQRFRVGAAAIGFCANALLVTGLLSATPLTQHVLVGGGLLISAAFLAAIHGRLPSREPVTISYREIAASMARLGAKSRASVKSVGAQALGCLTAFAVVSVGAIVGGMPPALAVALCAGAFLAFRNAPKDAAPDIEEARKAFAKRIQRSF